MSNKVVSMLPDPEPGLTLRLSTQMALDYLAEHNLDVVKVSGPRLIVRKANTDEKIIAVYADGGVVSKNPSSIGGTWAWCHVDERGQRVNEDSGYISAADNGQPVSNNVTELLALLNGIDALPAGWIGTVYSDSLISLGRVFQSWKLHNCPAWLLQRMGEVLRRHDVARMTYVLLDGHLTKEQLATGKGKRGNPVSEHNVWCDEACGAIARKILEADRRPEIGD